LVLSIKEGRRSVEFVTERLQHGSTSSPIHIQQEKVVPKQAAFLVAVGLLSLLAIGGVSQAVDPEPDPQCVQRDLVSGLLVYYECDRYQSKGDFDSITPQIKIVSPAPGDTINYKQLPDANNDGIKELAIKVVASPEFTFDFTAASSAGTQYAFLGQVDGVGHAHAYIAPAIEVATQGQAITGVDFVGSGNRADLTGGFCVFQNADPDLSIPGEYQVLTINCPLSAGTAALENGDYRVIVDFTENSHGPRMKHSPRDVPPGDQITIKLRNVH
jgi:hypothetical protein